MYSRLPHHIFSLGRFLAVFALLVLVMVEEGYGQRVYADAENNSYTPLLASIMNPNDAVDVDTTRFSRLNVTLGLGGLVQANQNIYFSNAPLYLRHSPIVVKFSTPGSLLDLLGGLSIQRTNADINILPSYGGSSLLELLNLFGGGNVAMLQIPPTEVQYNGVRLTVNTTLGVARTARYYYAFYITPPQITHNEITLCEGETGAIEIQNHYTENGSPYTYRLYDSEIGGAEVELVASTVTAFMTVPSELPAGSYWLEARENDLYPSARAQVVITRSPVPHRPQLSITSTTN